MIIFIMITMMIMAVLQSRGFPRMVDGEVWPDHCDLFDGDDDDGNGMDDFGTDDDDDIDVFAPPGE